MKALLYVLLAPVCALWAGFVTSALWGWFIVPLGVREIGMVQGAGIDLLIGFLLSQLPMRNELLEAVGKKMAAEEILRHALLVPGVFLLFGWLLHLVGGLA